MRKPVLLIFTNACLLIAIFGLLAQSLFIVQRVAQVKSVRGQVEIKRSGGEDRFIPLQYGDPVKMGDIVRTGTGSTAEFGWLDGTCWKMLGNSQITIEKASFSSTKKSEVSRLDLDMGKVLVRVSKILPETSRFEVKTPTTLVVTHGKVFSVQVDNGLTAVDVYKGSVEVSGMQEGGDTSLSPGKRAVETGIGWKIQPSDDQSAFENEEDFSKPHLEVNAKLQGNGYAIVTGQAEADSNVLIDGEKVKVLDTGVFLKRVKVKPGLNSWKIETTDSYGDKNSMVKNLEVGAETPCPTTVD